MARPELAIGTSGKIRIEKLGPKRFRARARFRDYDGITRDIEATDTTGPAAERTLKAELRGRATPADDEITRESRISALAELWVEEITAEERIPARPRGAKPRRPPIDGCPEPRAWAPIRLYWCTCSDPPSSGCGSLISRS